MRIFQLLILLAVLGFMARRIQVLGWRDVVTALPETPWFYFLFCIRFLTIPATEVVIYGRLLARPLVRYFDVFIRKNVYNQGFFDYSGEAFWTLWIRQHMGIPVTDFLGRVKDVNILSAVVGSTITLGITLILWADGRLAQLTQGQSSLGLALLLITSIGVVAALLAFRRQVFSLAAPVLLWVTAAHSIRFLVATALQWAMYVAVFPHIAPEKWGIFIAAQLILGRLPLIPNKELVFFGLAMGMAGVAQVPEAALVGLFLASAGLNQTANLVLFAVTSLTIRRFRMTGAAG